MNNLVAITQDGEKKVVTDYKVVNYGTIMNPEMYIDMVEIDGVWFDADVFNQITFDR